MRAHLKVRALVGGTITAGVAALAAAPFLAADVSVGTLALLAAAVVVTELIQVPSDETSLDPGDAHSFSFSTGVHLAAILIVGPWVAALIAAFGVVFVDRLRGGKWYQIAFNASVFALSALAGGLAFQLLGGSPGSLNLPGDFPAVAALVLTAYAVNNLFMSAVVAFNRATSFVSTARETARDGLSFLVAEGGLGFTLAFLALTEPWAIVALVPLVGAVYRSYERLAILRRETAHALETFANVVDERDAYTYRHSDRVAEYVESLAEALALPARLVHQLRWAGRLHDLGKITVDASILRKPGKLDEAEWAAMRLHPRLSARLLRRFHLASDHARAVEYHHERYDGKGYYGVASAELPLAAHFLIVADSYDAMTSDRPYRDGLPPEVAIAEIEKNAGSQFHPAVAKAFVALQRGEDAVAALTPEEYAGLREAATRRAPLGVARALERHPEFVPLAGLVAALLAVAAGWHVLAVPATALAVLGVAFTEFRDYRGRRLARRLRGVLAAESLRDELFARLTRELEETCGLRWAGLVLWWERECHGVLDLEWRGLEAGPSERSLTSWFIREAEASTHALVASGAELGYHHPCVAVPLRRDDSLVGYLALAVDGRVTRSLREALEGCAEAMASRLLEPETERFRPRLEAVAG